jgi:polyphosphate kinase 2 (PPK2 family)
VDEGIILIKLWLEVSNEEQERRFRSGSRIRGASGS